MKLCVILVLVASLAALCAAEPADGSAPRQPSGVLRFKRDGIQIGDCPTGFIRRGSLCMPEDYVPGQPSGRTTTEVLWITNPLTPRNPRCPRGYIIRYGICIQENIDDYYKR